MVTRAHEQASLGNETTVMQKQHNILHYFFSIYLTEKKVFSINENYLQDFKTSVDNTALLNTPLSKIGTVRVDKFHGGTIALIPHLT